MTAEERSLLDRMAGGEFDGPVGDILEYGIHRTVYFGKYIKGGIPVSFRQGELERFFNGQENERIPGTREEEHFETEGRKLEFLRRFGWLMKDETVKAYSAKFKPAKD